MIQFNCVQHVKSKLILTIQITRKTINFSKNQFFQLKREIRGVPGNTPTTQSMWPNDWAPILK